MLAEKEQLEAIQSRLNTNWLGRTTANEYYSSIDSTNSRACQLARQGAPSGLFILANLQTAGKGRLGRSWLSQENSGIYLSVLLRPNIKQENFPLFTLAAGVASAKAIEDAFGLTIALKWVNDLILERKKLGGILCELASGSQATSIQPAIIIGIGINLDLSTTDIPEDLQDKITWLYKATPNTATSNEKKVCDYKTSKYEIIAAILNNLEKLSDCISNGDHETVTQLWKKYSCTLGQEVIVSSGQAEKVIAGYAKDINDKGALILVDNEGKEHTIYAGDISIRNADGTYC